MERERDMNLLILERRRTALDKLKKANSKRARRDREFFVDWAYEKHPDLIKYDVTKMAE